MDYDLLTVAEIAVQLKVTTQSVRNWMNEGRLAYYRVGERRVRISRSDLERFIAAGSSRTPPLAGPTIWDGNLPDPVLATRYSE